MNAPELKYIGLVQSNIQSPEDAPKNYRDSSQEGSLEIYEEYREAMVDIKVGDTIVLLCWLHESKRDVLKVYPQGDRSKGLRGVFSTRSPARPNPIAISELRVTAIDGTLIHVYGLDFIDGTPIVDIKKKI